MRQTHPVTHRDPDSPSFTPSPPLSVEDFAQAEESLGTLLPDPLVRMYRGNNGVFNEHGQWWTVWPVAQMLEARTWLSGFSGYLDEWIPFGDDGTGDPYCFHRADDSITRLSMIDGAHEPFAHGLADFWTMITV